MLLYLSVRVNNLGLVNAPRVQNPKYVNCSFIATPMFEWLHTETLRSWLLHCHLLLVYFEFTGDEDIVTVEDHLVKKGMDVFLLCVCLLTVLIIAKKWCIVNHYVLITAAVIRTPIKLMPRIANTFNPIRTATPCIIKAPAAIVPTIVNTFISPPARFQTDMYHTREPKQCSVLHHR